MSATAPISVLCVDDNPHVADALRIFFSRKEDFTWAGWLETADHLAATAQDMCPDIVLLDLDMPGRDPFEALAEVAANSPDTRVIIFSGHVRKGLVARAIDCGAWGYVSKNDGEEALYEAIRKVADGDFVLSDEVRNAFDE